MGFKSTTINKNVLKHVRRGCMFFILNMLLVLYTPYIYAQVSGTFIYSASIGAIGDGKHDDTALIQNALDSLSNLGGGVLVLERGEFLISSIKTGTKTSIKGAGIGTTIIKQKPGASQPCISIPEISGGLNLEDFTIVGNDKNAGINIEKAERGSNDAARSYISSFFTDKRPAKYKWIKIDNISVFNFDIGINVEAKGFNVNIQNCNIENNGDGVVYKCSDSSISNCYIENNKRNGIVVYGSNNKLLNLKSIFNGINRASDYAAVRIEGARCQLTNIETQDNYCKGFYVAGRNNILMNCISNTDGYTSNPFHYEKSTNACGFYIASEMNIFMGCLVTSYTNNSGAVYHSPVIIKTGIEKFYPNIYSDIKVMPANNMLAFHEPQNLANTVPSINHMENTELYNDSNNGKYFKVSNAQRTTIKVDNNYSFDGQNILVDFKISPKEGFSNWPRIFTIGEGNTALDLVIYPKDETTTLTLYSGSGFSFPIQINENIRNIVGKDLRMVISFSSSHSKTEVWLRMYLCNAKGEWYRASFQRDVTNMMSKLSPSQSVVLGNRAEELYIKRFIMTRENISEEFVLPKSNTTSLQPNAEIYIDADSWHQ